MFAVILKPQLTKSIKSNLTLALPWDYPKAVTLRRWQGYKIGELTGGKPDEISQKAGYG